MAELLNDVRTSFSGQAEAVGVALEVVVDGGQEAMIVWADYGRLDQVLGNLMANALRYTPPDGVITMRAKSQSGGVRITVSDTGEGIPPEDLPYIFDRFWRGDRSRPHTGGSSGLGLAIAHEIINRHHGRITVESDGIPGKGTTFHIWLPAQPSEE